MYQVIEFSDSPEQSVGKIQNALSSKGHFLLLPPRFTREDISISNPTNADDSIGLCSSGTTGDVTVYWIPKSNLLSNAKASIPAFELSKTGKYLVIASPWHVAGLTWILSLITLEALFQVRFPTVGSEEEWGSKLSGENYSALFTVPGAMRLLKQSNAAEWIIPSLIIGGGSLDKSDSAFLANHFENVFLAYGQTEAGGLISTSKMNTRSLAEEDVTNCGVAADGVSLQCDGTLESPSAIMITSAHAAVSEEYNSGDVGYFDSRNNLHVTGRVRQGGGNCNKLTAVSMIAHK